MFATHGVINFLLLQPFHKRICNLSAKATYLAKHMVVTYATESLTTMMTASYILHFHPPTGTSDRLDHFALRNEQYFNCRAEHNCALGKALQAKHDNVHNLVGSGHYKTFTDR